MPKYLPVLTSQRLIWLAGLPLITAGVVCLYLSDAVARPESWWQGTLDAFGVGFTVGGIVDVVAISLMNQVLTRDQARRELSLQADAVIYDHMTTAHEKTAAARGILRRGWSLLDPARVRQLRQFIIDAQVGRRQYYTETQNDRNSSEPNWSSSRIKNRSPTAKLDQQYRSQDAAA
jgi:hypothetical protein